MATRLKLSLVAIVLLFGGAAIFYFGSKTLDQPTVVGSVDQFKDTEIVAHPDALLDPKKNMIWCGTIGLAWNEAITFFRGPLVLSQPNPAAESLNRQEFTTADLDPESYAVAFGNRTDRIEERFRDELLHKFGVSANPPILDNADTPLSGDDVAMYAYLQKSLKFATPFDTNEPFPFAGRKVASFGFGFESSPSSESRSELTSQVRLLSYESQDRFIVQLKTTSSNDQLVLAKIFPGKTL